MPSTIAPLHRGLEASLHLSDLHSDFHSRLKDRGGRCGFKCQAAAENGAGPRRVFACLLSINGLSCAMWGMTCFIAP